MILLDYRDKRPIYEQVVEPSIPIRFSALITSWSRKAICIRSQEGEALSRRKRNGARAG